LIQQAINPWKGYIFLMVMLFMAWYSMHILQLPSFFDTMMMGEPHGDVLGMMTPYSNNFYRYSFTSMKNCLYNPILVSGDYDNN
jgi:hypothetical protein